MPSTDNQPPWAYLLRLPAGTGLVALRYAEQVMSRNGKDYFSVHRCMIGNPEIKDLCGLCFINGNRINRVSYIEHGSKISIHLLGTDFIFVDCNFGHKILRPIALNGTHAIGQLLGEGGFGQVYLCFEKKTSSSFALKITKACDREKEILLSVKHIHIIQTQFFINVDRIAFIGMEYMAGGDLSSYVSPGKVRLNENQTKLIFYQVVDAVSYLHGKGICHRDLKPANILLSHSNPHTLVKVTDLGISKSEMHSPMDTAIGTLRFMAPEITSLNYTKKVDVWSLGIILYLSLTGVYATVVGNAVPLQEFTSNQTVTNLLKKMLEISPTNRASITDVMNSEWLQDEKMKQEVTKLRRQKFSLHNENFEFTTRPEKLKQEDEGIGVAETIGLVVGGIVLLAFALLFR